MIDSSTAVESARALRPRLLERAAQCEALRRCPAETIDDLYETGLMQLMQPRMYGGSELGMDVVADVSFELAAACPSTAWVWLNLATHSWNVAQFGREAQDDVWARNPRAVAATGTAFPSGRAVKVEGGYRLTGRWPFGSGVDAADWMLVGAMVDVSEQAPEPRLMLVPKPDFSHLDNWDGYGLSGTGSHDVVVTDAFVPDHRTVAPSATALGWKSPGALASDSAVYRTPMFAGFGFALASVPLGATLAAVESFTETLRHRYGTYNESRLADLAPVQMRIAEATACVDFALNMYRSDLSEMTRLIAAADCPIDNTTKIRWKRNQAFAMGLCKRAVEAVMAGSGAGGLSTSRSLQRYFRDVNAAASHIGLTWDIQAPAFGRLVLGLPTPSNVFL